MSNNRKISIIVPVYNCEKYVEQCINSVLKQKNIDFELILVDDESSDNSLKICEKYACENVYVYTIKHGGGPKARNYGLAKSKGEWIVFLDADDYFDNEYVLSETIKLNDNCDIIIGNYKLVSSNCDFIASRGNIEKKSYYDKNVLQELCLLDPCPSNKFYRKKIISEYNIKFDEVKIAQDLNFYLKFLSVTKKALLTEKCIFNCRIVENSVSRTYTFKIFDVVESIKGVENFYKKNGYKSYIDEILPAVELYHYNAQMNKIVYFKNFKDRITVFNFFEKKIKEIDYSKSSININRKKRKVYIKFLLKYLLITDMYSKFYKKRHFKG